MSDSSVQLVKEAADIVEVIGEYVQLRKKGANYQGLCPFHNEKTPSFSVNPSRQFYHCFGCKESGDVFSFLMKHHNLTFREVLERLAERYGIEVTRQDLTEKELARLKRKEALYTLNLQVAQLYHDFLVNQPAAAKARDYLGKRGIGAEVIERYKLGYAPPSWDFLKNRLPGLGVSIDTALEGGLIARSQGGRVYDRFRDRILFPISSMDGRVAGFGGRLTGEGEPKYLNSPETAVFNKSRLLYGLYQARDIIRRTGKCLVVEGNFDLLALVEQGLDYVVAPLGTALTRHHIQSIKRYAGEATVLFDGDEAGKKAAMNTIPLFLTERLPARIVPLPENEDPDSFIRSVGRKSFEEKIKEAPSLPEFVFASLVRQHGFSLEGKNRIVESLTPLIRAIGNNQMQRSLFISHFSDKLGLSTEEMQQRLSEGGASEEFRMKRDDADAELPLQERQVLEFLLVYPDVLPRLQDAGMRQVCCNRIFLDIVDKLERLDGDSDSPEVLLDHLDDSSRSLVSRLLISAPCYPEESKESMVCDMEQWLRKKIRKVHNERLITRISEAQQKGDEILLLQLLEEKKKIDENGTGLACSF